MASHDARPVGSTAEWRVGLYRVLAVAVFE
jgi:hypothetical protein